MKKKIAVLALVALLPLLTAAKCDKSAGSDDGASAGDNQPKKSKCLLTEEVSNEQPAASLQDGDIKYDIFAELQDEDCNTVTLGGNPINIRVIGNIDGNPATYIDTATQSKDVNSPYHMTAFVTRGPRHDMAVHVTVVSSKRNAVLASDAEFIMCRIMRDGRPMRPEKSNAVPMVAPHVVGQLDNRGSGQAFCHFFLPVG